MSARYDTLLRLAALSRSTVEEDLCELERKLDDADRRLLFLAWRLLQGEAVEVNANTPERHAELRAFAEHVGATLEEAESGRVIFRPPVAQ
jgi:hypothetical protein